MHSTLSINTTKARKILFINSFVDQMSKELLQLCLQVDKNSNDDKSSLVSIFMYEMTKWLSIESFSLNDSKTSEVNKFLYLSYIKSFVAPLANHFANSYAEQLGLLELSEYGVVRFSHIVADSCIRYMKTKKSKNNVVETYSITSDLECMLTETMTSQEWLSKYSKKSLKLETGDTVKLSKFLKGMGIRQQIFNDKHAQLNKKYKYYSPVKSKTDSIKYGFRNALPKEEVNEKEFELIESPKRDNLQHIHTIYVMEKDVREYLSAINNPSNPLHSYSQNGFLEYLSAVYFEATDTINVVCQKLNLSNLNIKDATFDGIVFNSCDFSQAVITNTTMNNSVFNDCRFEGTVLSETKFHDCAMDFIDLSKTHFKSGNKFTKSTMRFGNLCGLDLLDTKLIRVNLTGANCIETDFRKSKYKYLVTDKIRTISTSVEGKQHPIELLSKVDTPFLPYQIGTLDNCHSPNQILNHLFTDSNDPGEDHCEINHIKLYHLAYGLYAAGEAENIVGVKKLYFCEKRNRANATEFFFDLLEAIVKRKNDNKKPQDKTTSIIPDTIISHVEFMSDINSKSKQQIDEYISLVTESIFEYDMRNYKKLEFYEIMQEAKNEKNKKPAENFHHMNESYNRIYYKVYKDIISSNMNDDACAKTFQFYINVAKKLCQGFRMGGKNKYNDLHGGAAIIQAISKAWTTLHSSISIPESHIHQIEELTNMLSPYNNFGNMRSLMTDRTIPYLPILSRDVLMSFEENRHSLFKQMTAFGVIQNTMFNQQMGPKQHIQGDDQVIIQSDFMNEAMSVNDKHVDLFMEYGTLNLPDTHDKGSVSLSLSMHGLFSTQDIKSKESVNTNTHIPKNTVS